MYNENLQLLRLMFNFYIAYIDLHHSIQSTHKSIYLENIK